MEAKRQRVEGDRPLASRGEERHARGRRSGERSPRGSQHERRRRRDSPEGGDRRRDTGGKREARGSEDEDARQGGSRRLLGSALKGSEQAAHDAAPVEEDDRWDMAS